MLKQSFVATTKLFSLSYFQHLFNSIETTAAIDGSNVVASFEEMEKQGLHWIMADFKIQFLDQHLFSAEYTIVTFPLEANALYALRGHNLYNAAGKLMAQSITRWVTMDIASRGLGRIPAYLYERVYEKEVEFLPHQKLRLTSHFLSTRVFNYRIGKQDIDNNAHTNNTVYMNLSIESASISGLDLSGIDTFSIQFKKETYFNDFLVVNSTIVNEGAKMVQVKINEGAQNAEISLAEIVFK
jgi:acyl-ACP thioesterase